MIYIYIYREREIERKRERERGGGVCSSKLRVFIFADPAGESVVSRGGAVGAAGAGCGADCLTYI